MVDTVSSLADEIPISSHRSNAAGIPRRRHRQRITPNCGNEALKRHDGRDPDFLDGVSHNSMKIQ